MNSPVSIKPGMTPARNSRPIEVSVAIPVQDESDGRRYEYAESSAGAYGAGGDLVRIAAPAHFRDSHLADCRAARRRGARQRARTSRRRRGLRSPDRRAGGSVGQRSRASYRSRPAGEEPMAAPIITNMGIETRVNHSGPRRAFRARPEGHQDPGNITMKASESAPSPNATGAPESSTMSVVISTRSPWVVGLTPVSPLIPKGSSRPETRQ